MIKRPVPQVYDSLHNLKTGLYSAYNIQDNKELGSIYELEFEYPYYLLDANKIVVTDEHGYAKRDNRVDSIVNELLVEFNNEWYVIKNVKENKADSGYKSLSVSCKHKSIDSMYKQVYYLNLVPPIHLPVDAKQAILETITYPYQIGYGYGKVSNVNGSQITLSNYGSEDYTGYKITSLEGTGKYQERRIVSYNTTTKIATLNSQFTPQIDTSTVCRVHNSTFELGQVDNSVYSDATGTLYRGFKFEDVTILNALNTISGKFNGHLTYSTHWDNTNSEFRTVIGLKGNGTYDGYEFRYKKNLKGISREIDTSEYCYTRVYPYGRNNLTVAQHQSVTRTDSGIVYNEHEFGKGEVWNFQYYLAMGYTLEQCKTLFVKDFKFIEEAYADIQSLYSGASKKLNQLSMPKISYSINGVDLNIIFPDKYTKKLTLGDTVRVVDNDLGFNFTAQVVKIDRNWNTPQQPSIVLSNFSNALEDVLKKLLQYSEKYSQLKSQYGKFATVSVADQETSSNWRYADYIVPIDKMYTADQIIQKAIDEVNGLGGGEVQLYDGTFKLHAYLNIPSSVKLVSSGGTLIQYVGVTPIATKIPSIGSLKETSDTHQSSITQNANQISLNVSEINGAKSSITQNANSIALKVSKNSVVSAINLSPENITISSSKINLVGAVTVLSDITGNLGTINAGTINGVQINSANINISQNMSIGSKLYMQTTNYNDGIYFNGFTTMGMTVNDPSGNIRIFPSLTVPQNISCNSLTVNGQNITGNSNAVTSETSDTITLAVTSAGVVVRKNGTVMGNLLFD